MTISQDSAMTVSQDTAQVQARIQKRLSDIKSLQLDTSILDALEDELEESHRPVKSSSITTKGFFLWAVATALIIGFISGAVFAA